MLQQASLAGLEALGPRSGRQVTRVRTFGGREEALPPRRLLRYALRPPLAKGRLSQQADGTVVLG